MADPARAVWLLPTREFHRARLDERDLPAGPRQLYLLLARTIEEEAKAQAARSLVVDGSRGIDNMVAAVEGLFADALAAGPRAETAADRRALLREANDAIAAQVRAHYARPWADGDAESVVRSFVCECGDTHCEANVELAVGALPATPVLATGHG